MTITETAEVAAEVVEQFWSLGGESVDLGLGRLVMNPDAPAHPLGNFLTAVRTETGEQLEALLADVEGRTGTACRRVLVDPCTPPVVEAHLALADWSLHTQLQLALPATVHVPGAATAMEPVRDDAGWSAIETLFRLDHLEEDARAGHAARPIAETRSAVSLRRSLAPAVTYFTAPRGDRAIGCIGVWARDDGIGMIEDVFVHPDARGAGLATEMLRFAVGHARTRGADPVLIGAEVDDTPKKLYARFGFRPVTVIRSYSTSP